jgi:hypothetical protein
MHANRRLETNPAAAKHTKSEAICPQAALRGTTTKKGFVFREACTCMIPREKGPNDASHRYIFNSPSVDMCVLGRNYSQALAAIHYFRLVNGGRQSMRAPHSHTPKSQKHQSQRGHNFWCLLNRASRA